MVPVKTMIGTPSLNSLHLFLFLPISNFPHVPIDYFGSRGFARTHYVHLIWASPQLPDGLGKKMNELSVWKFLSISEFNNYIKPHNENEDLYHQYYS